MTDRTHNYAAKLVWTGNKGEGAKDYKSYDRAYRVSIAGKPEFSGSADPAYGGDAALLNPEDMLLTSLSACHMLWYLHLCAVNKIVVTAYEDEAVGVMETHQDGSGEFKEVTLHPAVTVKPGADMEKAEALHERANKLCFIARSVNFPVRHQPTFEVAP